MAWIKNTGKQPVDDDVNVIVRLVGDEITDRTIDSAIGIPAKMFYWGLSDHAGSIAEYEVVDDIRTDESISA